MGADHVETISRAVSGAEICAVADIDPKRAETSPHASPARKLSHRPSSSSSRPRSMPLSLPPATRRMLSTSLRVSPRENRSCVKSRWHRPSQNVSKSFAWSSWPGCGWSRWDSCADLIQVMSNCAEGSPLGKSALLCSLIASTATSMSPQVGLPRQLWSAPLHTRSTSCPGFSVKTSSK